MYMYLSVIGAENPISGEFLEKKGLLRAALKRELELYGNVLSSEMRESISSSKNFPVDSRIQSLTKLNIARTFYSSKSLIICPPYPPIERIFHSFFLLIRHGINAIIFIDRSG